jgi:hypothetical protein
VIDGAPERVSALVGSDGWLFALDEAHDRALLDEAARDRLRVAVERQRRELSALGARYLIVAMPGKAGVLSNLLPAGIDAATPGRVDAQLIAAIAAAGRPSVDDVAGRLRAVAAQSFTRQERGATPAGALEVAAAVADALRTDGLRVPAADHTQHDWEPRRALGDLAESEQFDIADGVLAPRPESTRVPAALEDGRRLVPRGGPRPGRRPPPPSLGARRPPVAFEPAENQGLPRAVVFGDDQVDRLMLPLRPLFARSVHLRTTAIDLDLVRAERPDVVLHVLAAAGAAGALLGTPPAAAPPPVAPAGAEDEFALGGRRHAYHHDLHGRCDDNERTVELALALAALRETRPAARVLEIGNVLAHYVDIEHPVLDRYEDDPHVTWNEDVLAFDPPFAPDLVLSVSTLEHIGHSERPPDPDAFRRAVSRVIGWLAPDGRLLFTVPLGYNPAVLDFLESPHRAVTAVRYLRRVDAANHWAEAGLADVRRAEYDRPFSAANAVAVVEAISRRAA